jgi:hypothetical protein
MAVLQLGLVLAGVAALVVGGVSWQAGYTPEVAILRGVVACCAVGIVAYIGELVVGTAPPRRGPAVERLHEPVAARGARVRPRADASSAPADDRAQPALPAPATPNDGTAGQGAA